MHAIQGIRLLAANRSLWPWAWRPLAWAACACGLLGILLWMLLVPPLAAWVDGHLGGFWIAGALGSLILVALWVLLFSYAFLMLAGLFSSFLWDGLSQEVERLLGGAPAGPPPGMAAATADSILRAMVAGFAGIAALIGALATGPVLPVIIAAGVGLLDYTAPACLRRGRTLRRQVPFVLRARAVPFAVVAGLASLIPVVNVLMAPALVAGGTLLVRELDQSP